MRDESILGPTDADHEHQFRIFSLLWTVAAWFHVWNQVHWPAHMWWSPSPRQVSIELGMFIATMLVVVRPTDPRPFLAFLGFEFLHGFVDMPRVANHWYIKHLIDLAILGSAATVYLRDGRITASGWIRHFGPAARWILLIAYSWAAFAKLNVHFLDPNVSCASTTWQKIGAEWLPLPQGRFFDWLAITTTIVVEISIPALLLMARRRHWGVLIGLVFHYLISVPPQLHVPDFAMILFACWFLFLPPEFARRMREQKQAIASQLSLFTRPVVLGLITPVLMLPMLWYIHGPSQDLFANTMAWGRIQLFMVVGLAWVLLVIYHLRNSRDGVEELLEPMRVRNPWHLFLIAFTLLSGLFPYIGLRTTTNFAMFSNLRTEAGMNNHLLMPQLYLADYQNDLVTLDRTSIERLDRVVQRGTSLPFWELRFQVHRARYDMGDEPYVSFVRDGERHEVGGPEDYPPLYEPLGMMERWFLSFRPVEPGRPSTCQW